MQVFVLDCQKQVRNPIHPAFARKLLKSRQAAVYKRYPFTIIFKKEQLTLPVKPIRLKIDPGSKTTGIALVQGNVVIWAAELTHRGLAIRDALTSRRAIRRGRRARNNRYGQPRFLNRKKPKGWLAPSLMSRVHNILTWVKRLQKVCNLTDISQELVRFDMQKMREPELSSGTEYQQGSLMGYEVREYLLEKWKRKCAYCGVKDTPLEIEHIHPKCQGGSNSVNNLTLACRKCNQKKGEKDIKVFLKNKPEVLKNVLAQAKRPLVDAAAVNATRWELFRQLEATELFVETGTGGLTKFNRCQQNLPKTHWLDAACVGTSTPKLKVLVKQPLTIKATGHGTRQQCGTDKFGFPSRHFSRTKFHKGFQTGDIVKAVVTSGKKVGVHMGRVATRASGSFNISTRTGLIQGVSHKYCQIIYRKDGYNYLFGKIEGE